MDDGFDALVAQIGSDVVGKPLHGARYIGDQLVYQVTDKGKLEAVKLDSGEWYSYFVSSFLE